MKLALLELRRRPGRFSVAAVILTLVGLLLMFLGGLLDGLIDNSVAAIKAQDADVIVYASRAENSLVRSRLTAVDRAAIAAAPDVSRVGGLGVVQVGARLPDRGPRDLADVALFGYEIAPRGVPDPPPAGQAYADDILREDGVTAGMTLLLGPQRSPVTVIGFVTGTTYQGQGSLWAAPETWRTVQNANRPDEFVADGVFQAFVVQGSGGAQLAVNIDAATNGATASLTVTEAVDKLPGVDQQRTVFNQIIGVTVVIALVVVALFFALLTVERAGLYGVLKALGTRSRTLLAGLVLQAVIVSGIASVIAGAIALTLDAVIPAGSIPYQLSAGRLLSSVVFLVVAAVFGCAFSLRRVLRVDPAAAIGNAS